MFSLTKSSGVLLTVLLLTGPLFAQKNVAKEVGKIAKKPVAKSNDVYFVPYKNAGKLQNLAPRLAQTSFLAGWERFAMQLERQQAAAAVEREVLPQTQEKTDLMLNAKTFRPTTLSHEELEAYAKQQTQFLADYLAEHQQVWPRYAARSQEAALLKRIANFMEVEEPSFQIFYIQREIIRLRAQSKAYSPQEILSIVQDMMKYGVVPSRAYLSEKLFHTEDELAIGEELAFAMAAYKVPMKDNPWKIAGMEEVIDKVTTHYAMRRVDPMFEGLPATFEKDGIHYSNFPIWTRKEFVRNQQEWFQKHPFEYALASYWETIWRSSLYRVYNSWSDIEKQAIMFVTPKLPKVADASSSLFVPFYDKALQEWMDTYHKSPQSRVIIEQEEYLGAVLADSQRFTGAIRFRDANGQYGDFADLAYPQQLEVLMWIWQKYQIMPQQALQLFAKHLQPYF